MALATVLLHVCGSFALTYVGLRSARWFMSMIHWVMPAG